MASRLFTSPTSRLSLAKEAQCVGCLCFLWKTQRNYQGNSLGKTLQRRFHLPVRTATRSPLTA
ncbi:hypothetical protein SAMN02927897_00425 [Kosakonia sacchari]|uniref:Uncharacterized protein n=1 Tax=Kosakonia sacchari TaxID=1158459 RepID=A0A1G4XCR4_9ENTR|nr:hypothetical protein SAMN02927897_00425 [Kosakonia sacchari]